MIYLTGSIPASDELKTALRKAGVGVMKTPNIGYSQQLVATFPCWAADNGCFSANWDEGRWLTMLERWATLPSCLFAVVPDVVGDAYSTRLRWDEWAWAPAAAGYTCAYVLQDGETGDTVPWEECGALFIGGSTEYKLSDTARLITAEAKRRGMWVHMGRVNGKKRLRLAESWGVDSADGTFIGFGPDNNVPRLLHWLEPDEVPPWEQLALL